MISRYFFALCSVVLFAAVASISVEKAPRITNDLLFSDSKDKLEKSQLQEIPNRDLVDEIIRVLQEICAVAKNCLKDVTNECKRHWLNPLKFLDCVKNYIQENKEKCTNPGFAQFY